MTGRAVELMERALSEASPFIECLVFIDLQKIIDHWPEPLSYLWGPYSVQLSMVWDHKDLNPGQN